MKRFQSRLRPANDARVGLRRWKRLAHLAVDFSGNAVGYQGERSGDGGTGGNGPLHRYSRVLRRFVERRYSRCAVVPCVERAYLEPRRQSRIRTLFHKSRRNSEQPSAESETSSLTMKAREAC